MTNIKVVGCNSENTLRLLGCLYRQQPNHLIMGDKVERVEQPKQPNNLIVNSASLNDNSIYAIKESVFGCTYATKIK